MTNYPELVVAVTWVYACDSFTSQYRVSYLAQSMREDSALVKHAYEV